LARFTYTVLSTAVAGKEEEFIDWYINQHLVDVTAFPEVVSAKLHKLDFHRVYNLDDAPKWTLLTIYELECDDPETTVNKLRDASGSPAMPSTEALTKVGMVQVVGHLIAER
jgi:epsilon-lactone hydrolase